MGLRNKTKVALTKYTYTILFLHTPHIQPGEELLQNRAFDGKETHVIQLGLELAATRKAKDKCKENHLLGKTTVRTPLYMYLFLPRSQF